MMDAFMSIAVMVLLYTPAHSGECLCKLLTFVCINKCVCVCVCERVFPTGHPR